MDNAGTAIHDMRTARRLTIRELARKAGVNSAYLSQVENGERNPSRHWVHKITDAIADDMLTRGALR